LRYLTNERSDSLQSVIPISNVTSPVDQPIVIPYFADGVGWKSRITLVNNTDQEVAGEVQFMSPGAAGDPVHPVEVGVGTDSTTSSVFEYHIQPRSYFEVQTNGLLANLSSGSVKIAPFAGYHTPAAYATISQFTVDQAASDAAGETRGNTIFETSVEGQVPTPAMRFYAEGRGDFDGLKARSTGRALPLPIHLLHRVYSTGGIVLRWRPAWYLIAYRDSRWRTVCFLSAQVPGLAGLPVTFQGVVSVKVLSGTGVTGTSFRVLLNERSENLVATTGPLNENAGMPGRLIFPYLSDSTGYTTQFLLVKPAGGQASSGVLRFYATDGTPLQLDTVKLGSIQIVPFGGSNTPHAYNLLYHRDAGVLTSIVGIEGDLPAKEFRVYVEDRGDFPSGEAGATRSTIALANPSDAPATAVLEMRNLDGTISGRPFRSRCLQTGKSRCF
jgi:hypothetical protein